MRRITIFIVFMLTAVLNPLLAQEDCELTLTRATEEFQAGHFSNIPAVLNECLPKFSNEQKQRAHLLLTQAYLLLDDPIGAKNSYLQILKVNPEFIADPAIHPVDVVFLSKRFTASPIFAWFLKGGSGTSFMRVIQDNNAFGQKDVHEKYNLKAGYHFYAGADYYVFERIALRGEIGYQFSPYELTSDNFFKNDTKSFQENMGWVNAPLSVMYTKKTGRFRPYGYVGYGLNYLLRDRAVIQSVRVSNVEGSGKDDKQSPSLNFIEKRNRINTSFILGGGVKGKFGLQYFFIDVRYSIGRKNIVNPVNLYADQSLPLTSSQFLQSGEPVTSYAHVDDFFRMDNLSISLGFIQPFYKPREIKQRGKSIFKSKIKKTDEKVD